MRKKNFNLGAYEPEKCWVGEEQKICYGSREEAEMAAKVAEYEEGLFEYLRARYSELLDRIEHGYWDDSDIETMKEALTGYNKR